MYDSFYSKRDLIISVEIEIAIRWIAMQWRYQAYGSQSNILTVNSADWYDFQRTFFAYKMEDYSKKLSTQKPFFTYKIDLN